MAVTKRVPRVKKAPETKTEVAVEESEAKKSYRAFMESYKLQKPEKYAIKEAAFINHLNTL